MCVGAVIGRVVEVVVVLVEVGTVLEGGPLSELAVVDRSASDAATLTTTAVLAFSRNVKRSPSSMVRGIGSTRGRRFVIRSGERLSIPHFSHVASTHLNRLNRAVAVPPCALVEATTLGVALKYP